MKIAIVHLSDFHVKSDDRFSDVKINRFIQSLNVLGNVDRYILVVSGDLANSGQVNEYKRVKYIVSRIISALKEKSGNSFVNLFVVPGNHDLCLPENARESQDIISYYNNDEVEEKLKKEFDYLDNYYSCSVVSKSMLYDKLICREVRCFDEYKLQFNLINTAPFSTLKPDDKELHFFTKEKLHRLKKGEDVDVCITVMHHNTEWFFWKYKNELEKSIIDNSEILLTGHDHCEKTSTVSIGSGMDTCVSAAGRMDFTSADVEDSFNLILINAEKHCFTSYEFIWNLAEKIYEHKISCAEKAFQDHTAQMVALPSYIKTLKEDTYNNTNDFMQYFVFPKLTSEYKNEFGKHDEVTSSEEWKRLLKAESRVQIIGSENYGKTTLLKYTYIMLKGDKVPLLFLLENRTKIKPNKFIKTLFEEQYGSDSLAFEKYRQLDKEKRVLLIDNWDLINKHQNISQISDEINDFFGYVIYTVSSADESVLKHIKNEMTKKFSTYQVKIKPFFAEKRKQLIENIYTCNNLSVKDVPNVTRIVDALVRNNSGLFHLNPAFIFRYTNYMMKNPYYDYTKGETAFSKVFEFELEQSIMSNTEKEDVAEILTAFEEIAGYMYNERKDILKVGEVQQIVDQYRAVYGVTITPKLVIETGERAKLIKKTDDYDMYFANKNQFAYFIAKYLMRISQDSPPNNDGIIYALKNICFGINADIILFISYLSGNTKILMDIVEHAQELLSPWEELELSENNITFFSSNVEIKISPPTEEEQNQYEKEKEIQEEITYSDETIEAIGIFDYDIRKIDEYQYRLMRSIKYTEMICRALPAFHNSLKLTQKKEIVNAIYSYPRKICYAMLRPIDLNIDVICEELERGFNESEQAAKVGEITKEQVRTIIRSSSRAMFLSMVDHFTEICTSPKTFSILCENNISDASEMIERLLIFENNGDSDLLLREAKKIIKKNYSMEVSLMAKLIVKKHVLSNPRLTFSEKQQFVDKIWGKEYRRDFHLVNK